MQAEIYSYSRSRGLFAGVSLDGSALKIDQAAAVRYYQQPNLPQGQVAVADRRQIFPGEALVDEQPHLFQVLLPHLLAQGAAHGMGAGFGHGGEDEPVMVGNDHASGHPEKGAPPPEGGGAPSLV